VRYFFCFCGAAHILHRTAFSAMILIRWHHSPMVG
jgi:hypothetical protein